MRFDSLRREPWSTIITPSLSPTACGFCLIPPFPLLKQSLLFNKYLLFEGLVGSSRKLGGIHLRWVLVLVVSLTKDLRLHQDQKQMRNFSLLEQRYWQERKIGIEIYLVAVIWGGMDKDSIDIFKWYLVLCWPLFLLHVFCCVLWGILSNKWVECQNCFGGLEFPKQHQRLQSLAKYTKWFTTVGSNKVVLALD